MNIEFRDKEESVARRLIWLSDLHLDAVNKAQYFTFFDLIKESECDAVLIGGDISNGLASFIHLSNLFKILKKQCYFVLGNHDFYYGSIETTRQKAQGLSQDNPLMTYLTTNGIIPLTEKTALIGHDGWADGRLGDFLNSQVLLNDYFLIEELRKLNQRERLVKLNQLGAEAAEFLKNKLEMAFNNFEKVLILTHVPPFKEACYHKNVPGDDHWTPHFVCHAVGEVLLNTMKARENKQLLVLCGHTHSAANAQILPNLHVIAGQTELGLPNIQGFVHI